MITLVGAFGIFALGFILGGVISYLYFLWQHHL